MAFFKGQDSSFYNEESILKISDIVSWKKERNSYNFRELPSVAIIAIKKNVFSKVISPFTKRIKGVKGIHYNYKSKFLLCSEFGMGSSSLITLLEELRELGVKQFIFIGVAGMLDSSVKENKNYIISKVYSSVGSSFFYAKNEDLKYFDEDWFQKIKMISKSDSKISWSTDCPFRETKSLIENFKQKKCSLVEMESAGLYTFAQYYRVPAVSILVGADDVTTSQWSAPKDFKKLVKTQQELIAKLIKSL